MEAAARGAPVPWPVQSRDRSALSLCHTHAGNYRQDQGQHLSCVGRKTSVGGAAPDKTPSQWPQ